MSASPTRSSSRARRSRSGRRLTSRPLTYIRSNTISTGGVASLAGCRWRSQSKRDRGGDVGVPPRVVDAVAADEAHRAAVLGDHPVPVHLLFVDPAVAVEGLAHERWVHCFDERDAATGHRPSL